MKKTVFHLCIIFFFFSCNEEVIIPSNFDENVFIQGSVLSTFEKVSIEIVRSQPIYSKVEDNNGISNAQIGLYEKDPAGNEKLITDKFQETENGIYHSLNPHQGKADFSYWIEVTLPDGTQYTSTPDKMPKNTEVKEVRKTDDFYSIIFSDPKDERNYYLYYFTFEDENGSITSETDIYTSNDLLFDGNSQAELAASTEIKEYAVTGYIVAVNYETFAFFQKVEKQLEETASSEENDPSPVFFSSPVNLKGNIINHTTSKNPYGYFFAGAFFAKTIKL